MTVALMTWRALTRGWRPLLLLALPVGGLVLALLLRFAIGGPDAWFAESMVRNLGVGLILPLTALLVAVSGLGNEVDDSSILHVLATPIPRWRIALEKVLVIGGVSVALGALNVVGMRWVLGSDEGAPAQLGGWLLISVVAALAYATVFSALSCWVRHAVVIGALYLVLWEGVLMGLAPRARFLSLWQGSLALGEGVSQEFFIDLTTLSPAGGMLVLGVAVVGGMLAAAWGLTRVRLGKSV